MGPYARVDSNLTLSRSQLQSQLPTPIIIKNSIKGKGYDDVDFCYWLDTYVSAHNCLQGVYQCLARHGLSSSGNLLPVDEKSTSRLNGHFREQGTSPCQADFSPHEPTKNVASGLQKEQHPYESCGR
jgi:hypothetical protein